MSMKSIGGVAVIMACGLVAVWLLAGCATTGNKMKVPPVTVGQIVQMSKDGVAPSNIIAQIRASATVYRLQASELARLKAQGVADEVIDYMQQTYLHAIQRDQQLQDSRYWTRWDDGYWYGGLPFGWPYDPLLYSPEVIVVPEHVRPAVEGTPGTMHPGGGHHP